MVKKKLKLKKSETLFLLTGKKLLIIILAFFLVVLLHNLIYALLQGYYDSVGGDEPFFFIMAVIIIPLYFIICLIYTLIKKIRDRTILKREFILRIVVSIIIGSLASFIVIQTTKINPPTFFILALIFTFIVYFLSIIKLRKKKV